MNLDIEVIKNMNEEEVSTFSALDYKNKTLDQLKVSEYHSYQIGYLLRYINMEDRTIT